MGLIDQLESSCVLIIIDIDYGMKRGFYTPSVHRNLAVVVLFSLQLVGKFVVNHSSFFLFCHLFFFIDVFDGR